MSRRKKKNKNNIANSKKAIEALKSVVTTTDNAADDAAFYPMDKKTDEEERGLIAHMKQSYDEAQRVIDLLVLDWRDNRDAFMLRTEDQFGGDASTESLNGKSVIFNTAITHQGITDIVSIVNSSNTTISPLPVVRSQFKDEAWVNKNFPAIMAVKRPEETPVDYVRRIVGLCYEDINHRRNMHEKDAEIIRDVCLCGIGYSYVYTDFDWDTMQQDIFVTTVQPENVKLSPNARGINETCLYMHLDVYMTPYEAAQMWPEFKDEIFASIIRVDERQYTSYDNIDRMKGLIKVVKTYLKDMTKEQVPVLELDPQTQQPVQKKDPETGELLFEETRKYPHGRVITWLYNNAILLDDDEGERGVFPVSCLTDRKPSWTAIGAPVANALRPAETVQNMIYQQMIGNMRKAGNVIAEYTDGVNFEDVSNEIGARIKVTALGQNLLIHGCQNIVGNAVEASDMVNGAKDRMVGLSAASVGDPPPGIDSGVALAQMQAPTNRVMGEFQKNYYAFKRDQGLKIGYLMLDMYKSGRVLHVADEDGNPVTLVFDLGDAVLDIVSQNEVDSFLPRDPKSMMDFAIAMTKTMCADGQPFLDRQGAIAILGRAYPALKQAAVRADKRAQQMQMAKMQAQAASQQPKGAMNPSMSGLPNGPGPVSAPPAQLGSGATQ